MAWTTPKTWATSDSLGASTLNSHLRDNLNFLYGPPRCRVYNNANLSVNDSTETGLTFNTERFDTDTMHSTSVNTGRITITTAGYYLFHAHVQWAGDADGYRDVYIRVNGTTRIAESNLRAIDGSVGPVHSVSGLWACNAADYVEVIVFHTAGAAINVLSGGARSPEFSAIWMAG